jgi:hypothetical protein
MVARGAFRRISPYPQEALSRASLPSIFIYTKLIICL